METLILTIGAQVLKLLEKWDKPELYVPACILIVGAVIAAILVRQGKKNKNFDVDIEQIALSGIATDLSSMKTSLTTLETKMRMLQEGDTNITEQQAQRIYETHMDWLYGELYKSYKICKHWLNKKDKDEVFDDLNFKMEELFAVIYSDLNNRLKDFTFEDILLSNMKPLKSGDMNHIRVHLFNCLMENKNGIKEYLEGKLELQKNIFNELTHKARK